MDAVRTLITQIVRERDLNLSDVSAALGRNHAYMQQFLKRGIPAKLPEDVRPVLAEFLGIDEAALGAPVKTAVKTEKSLANRPGMIDLPEYDIRAGANYAGGIDGNGEFNQDDIAGHKPVAHWGLPSAYVQNGLGLRSGSIDIITVEGNSMDDGSRYALISGDKVIIDRLSVNVRQGGIFAIYDGITTIVKQVEYVRDSEPPRIVCKSLNQSYQPFEVILDGNAHVIGRVSVKITRV